MPRIDAIRRHDLTDAQWELLEPLLPVRSGLGRPLAFGLRDLIDGVRHRARTGAPWRDVPPVYGPWWRVYALFRSWQILGVWQRIESGMLDAVSYTHLGVRRCRVSRCSRLGG